MGETITFLSPRSRGGTDHSQNIFQIILESNERGIKLFHGPRSAEICRQSMQLAAQDRIDTADGVQRHTQAFIHFCLDRLDIPPAHQQAESLPLIIAHHQIIPQNRALIFRLISQFEGEEGNGFQVQFHGGNP